jgi:PilZ domain
MTQIRNWRSCLGIFGQSLSATFVTFREFRPLNTLESMEVHRDEDSRLLLLSGHAAERRWPRYKVDVPIQLATQGITNGIIVQGRGSELNCGGMAVSGSIELAIGEQVAVEFTPPHSGQPVSVRCFVRNRHRYAYGLEFIAENDFDYESVAQIEATLRHIALAGSAEA